MIARLIAPKNPRPSPVPSFLFNVTTSIDVHKTRDNSSRGMAELYDNDDICDDELDVSRVSLHACDVQLICRY